MFFDAKGDLPETWQWPGLWSVNLPVLAVLWHQLFTQSFGMWFGGYHFFATAGLVWAFVAGERWLYFFRQKTDAAETLSGDIPEQKARMIRIALLIVIGLVLVAVVGAKTRETAGMLLWTTVGGAYLTALRIAPDSVNEILPREMALATFLSGTSLLFIWANAGFQPVRFLLPGMLFLLLLFYYFCLVGSWSVPLVPVFANRPILDGTGGSIFRGIPVFLIAAAALLLIFNNDPALNTLFISIAISALILLLLDAWPKTMPKPARRIFADLAMLTPALPLLIL